jgi:hypothetical protein
VRTDCILLPIFYLNSFWRNVQPSSCIASEIDSVKTFETVVFELCMFGGQSDSFDLQSQTIQFNISRPENFSLRVSGDEKKPIFIQPINASEDILQREFRNFGNVDLCCRCLEVIFCDGIDLVFWAFALVD